MQRDAIDFEKTPVGELFRKMLWPTLLGMVSLVVLNITDGAFVGHGAGSDALAAVNIVAPVFMVISGIGLMFGIGGSVVASVHLANGKFKAADINITQAIIGGFLICSISAVVMLCFQEQTVKLFGSSDALVPLSCSYLKWIAASQPVSTLSVMGMFFVRLDGSPKIASAITVATALLNIVLDYLFIYPLHMGLEGAAIATALSYMISGLAAFIYVAFFGKKIHLYRLKWSFKSLRLTLRNLGYQIKIGFSALLGELAMASLMIVGNYQFIKMLGEDGVAAFSVACYLLPVVFMVANAIVDSVQPIISYAHGAGNKGRIKSVMKLSLGTGISSGLAVIVVLCAGSSLAASIFLEKGCKAWELCCDGLPMFCVSTVFTIINVIMVGYNQSVERGHRATFYTVLRGFVFMIPAFLLLPIWLGEKGLWLALVVAEMLTTIVILCMESYSLAARR